jgi:hypothetical protein
MLDVIIFVGSLGVRLEKLRFGVIHKKVSPILIVDELTCK